MELDEAPGTVWSRDIAIVLYFASEGWSKENGGLFVDHATGRRFVPEFNSLVAFRVPREHEVTRCTGDRPRYSVFGWFLRAKAGRGQKRRR